MSQEEIFRKYMSSTTQARKKARNARRGNFQIVDNEVSMDSIPTGPTEDAEWGEEAPQVTEFGDSLVRASDLFDHLSL